MFCSFFSISKIIKTKTLKKVVFCLTILFAIGIYLSHLKFYQENKDAFFYENRPLLSTVDGYYHLNLVKNFLENNSKFSKIPTLIVPITIYLHQLTKIHIELLAFYLPAFFGILTILVYYFWGNTLGGFWLFILGALLGLSHAHWFIHAGLGRYDPECFLIFFIYLIPFFVYKFLTSSFPVRFLYLGIVFLLSGYFHFWYHWGFLFSIYLSLFSYAFSIFFYKKSSQENFIRYLILASICFLIIIALFPSLLNKFPVPDFFKLKILSAHNYLKKLTVTEGKFTPTNTLFSVAEFDKSKLLEIANSQCFFLFFALLGFLSFFKRAPKIAIFVFIVPASLSILAIKGIRFLLFAVPFYSLSLAAFLLFVYDFMKSKFSKTHYIPILVVAGLTAYCLYFNLKFLRSKFPYPAIQNCEVTLAVNGAKMANFYRASFGNKKKTIFWNWWDYGHTIRYFTQIPVIADNGNLSFWKFFMIAYPLVQEDPVLAKNWINYFARYGPTGFHYYNKFFKDYDKTLNFFEEVFSDPQKKGLWQKKYSFLKNKKLWERLFPKDRVVIVYLPHHMYLSAYWWYYFGSWSFKERTGIHPAVDRLSPQDYSIDYAKGILYLEKARIPLKKAVFYVPKGKYYLLQRKYYPNNSNYFFFERAYRGLSFLSEISFANSLFVKLTTYEERLGPALSIPFCGEVNILLSSSNN